MAVTPLQIHRLHNKVDEVLDEEHAATLMELLTGYDGTPRIEEILTRLDQLERQVRWLDGAKAVRN